MTLDGKRKVLSDYCHKTSCSNCVLNSNVVCTCGKGHFFTRKTGDSGYMTDAEIIGAYELVFGSTESTITSESTVTLESAVVDNSITISGVDKISNISICFKEEINA